MSTSAKSFVEVSASLTYSIFSIVNSFVVHLPELFSFRPGHFGLLPLSQWEHAQSALPWMTEAMKLLDMTTHPLISIIAYMCIWRTRSPNGSSNDTPHDQSQTSDSRKLGDALSSPIV